MIKNYPFTIIEGEDETEVFATDEETALKIYAEDNDTDHDLLYNPVYVTCNGNKYRLMAEATVNYYVTRLK